MVARVEGPGFTAGAVLERDELCFYRVTRCAPILRSRHVGGLSVTELVELCHAHGWHVRLYG